MSLFPEVRQVLLNGFNFPSAHAANMWRQSPSLTDTCSSSSSLGAHFIRVPRSVNRAVACFCNTLSRHIRHKTTVSMGVYSIEPLHVYTVYYSGFLYRILRATCFEQFSGHFTEFRAHASTVVPRPFFLRPGYEANNTHARIPHHVLVEAEELAASCLQARYAHNVKLFYR